MCLSILKHLRMKAGNEPPRPLYVDSLATALLEMIHVYHSGSFF